MSKTCFECDNKFEDNDNWALCLHCRKSYIEWRKESILNKEDDNENTKRS